VAAAAFPAPGGILKPEIQAWLDSAYACILPAASPEAMVQALGLGAEPRTDPDQVIGPAAPAPITRQAFLLDPDWGGGEWAEAVLSYLDAFRPGEPVLLILFLGRDRAGLSRDEATRRVVDLALGTGRQAFPDVIVLDSLADLGAALVDYPVHCRLNPARGNADGLSGPFGHRLAQARLARSLTGAPVRP
jgi:hypothetical protein